MIYIIIWFFCGLIGSAEAYVDFKKVEEDHCFEWLDFFVGFALFLLGPITLYLLFDHTKKEMKDNASEPNSDN